MTSLVIRTTDKTTDTHILAELTSYIQRLHHEAIPERFKPVPDDLSDFAAFFEKRLETGFGYIAEVDHTPVGMVLFDMREIEENPYVHSHIYMHIDQMGVKPAYRGQGIGQELMKKAIAYANKHGAVHIALNVWDFNDGAVNFYETMGYEVRYLHMHKILKKTK